MAARNPDSLTNQGEFHARVPPSEPIDKHGHKPGVRAAPADYLPTFSAQTLDPGTAPADQTFDPQTRNSGLELGGGAPEDLPGATSQDVNRGMGRPLQGMTSQQRHHDGQQGRKRQPLGLAKHGAGGEARGVDERADERQRGIEREEARPGRGDKAERAAEDAPSYMVTGKRP